MKTVESIDAIGAKSHLPALLERVAEGESLVITRKDKPVARLIPTKRCPGGRSVP